MRTQHWMAVLAATVAILAAGERHRSMWAQRTQAGSTAGTTCTYYIAADETGWNDGPAVYREYTDASFTTLMPPKVAGQPPDVLALALQGEVGDTITIVVKNNPLPGGSFTYTWVATRKLATAEP